MSFVCLATHNIELGQIIFLPEKGVTRVVVGNSDVLNAVPVVDGVVITAKSAGLSDVMLFFGDTKKVESFNVFIPKNEREKVLTLLENLGLTVQVFEGTYVIKGRVPNENTLNYVEGLVAILDGKYNLEIVIDKDIAQKELEELLNQLGVKLTLISKTAILSGSVANQMLHDGILKLTSSIYPEAVSLVEIRTDKTIRELPLLDYKDIKITDHEEVAIIEGMVDTLEEAEALVEIVEAFRPRAVSLLKIRNKEEELPQAIFKDLGRFNLEKAGKSPILTGETDSLFGLNMAKELFLTLYPDGVFQVKLLGGKELLRDWASVLGCEILEIGEIIGIKGVSDNVNVLLEIGKLYGLNTFVFSKEENALEFIRAFLDLEDIEFNIFKDTLYVKRLPLEKKREFELVALALFNKVIYLDEDTSSKEPYTVQVSGFQITQSDIDQIALDTSRLIQGWQEIVLSWQELGIIKDLAREWEVKQPSVMVFPGEKTSIHTGGQIPIPFDQGVEWQEFGVTLECQFGFVENGLIPGYLQIVVADLDWGNGITVDGTALPALKRYSYEGQVYLPKGGGVLLLRHWSKKEGLVNRSIPYLRELPVFGSLFFGSQKKQNQSQIMCVLVEVK